MRRPKSNKTVTFLRRFATTCFLCLLTVTTGSAPRDACAGDLAACPAPVKGVMPEIATTGNAVQNLQAILDKAASGYEKAATTADNLSPVVGVAGTAALLGAALASLRNATGTNADCSTFLKLLLSNDDAFVSAQFKRLDAMNALQEQALKLAKLYDAKSADPELKKKVDNFASSLASLLGKNQGKDAGETPRLLANATDADKVEALRRISEHPDAMKTFDEIGVLNDALGTVASLEGKKVQVATIEQKLKDVLTACGAGAAK